MLIRHTAAVALLTAAIAGCAPASPAVDMLPVPLVAALMNDNPAASNRPPREFAVDALPPGFPAALVPPAPVRTLGGVRTGDHIVAVFADSTRRVAAVLEEHLGRAGFTRPEPPPGSGFTGGFGPANYLCADSAMVEVEPLTGDERHLARVVYRRMRGASGCPPFRASVARPMDNGRKQLELPPLTAPPGVRVRGSGGGGGTDEVDSRANVAGDSLSAASLLAHYVAQLVEAGWTPLAPAVGERIAAQFLEAKDAAGATWHGALTAEGSGSSVRLMLRMHRSTP